MTIARATLGYVSGAKAMTSNYFKSYGFDASGSNYALAGGSDTAIMFGMDSGFHKRWYVGNFIVELGMLAGFSLYSFSQADEETDVGLDFSVFTFGGTALLSIGGQIGSLAIMLRTGFRTVVMLLSLSIDGMSFEHPESAFDRPLEIGATSTLCFLF